MRQIEIRGDDKRWFWFVERNWRHEEMRGGPFPTWEHAVAYARASTGVERIAPGIEDRLYNA